ncbi:MAG: hypothetical protein RLZZ175_2839, partial [Bacteroidota bacterium]
KLEPVSMCSLHTKCLNASLYTTFVLPSILCLLCVNLFQDKTGLHMLKDKDILKVLDLKTKNIICEGQLNEIPLIVFSQTKKGHFDQDKTRSWEQYFSDNYYAELHR